MLSEEVFGVSSVVERNEVMLFRQFPTSLLFRRGEGTFGEELQAAH